MTESTDQPLAVRLSEAIGPDYTIEGEIGRGGMGVVYRARDERLQRRVAVKVLPPELAFHRDIRERFVREAQTAAKLSHPHIVPIHTVGEGRGLVYFVMGYVDGESVAARVKRRGPLPPDEVRRIMAETADALGAAHALGVVHRDVKPDNILLEGSRGRVMVTDFGIAKALSTTSGATLTGTGVAIGTPSFMSPEQAAGEREIDGRSDLYSLGIVAYQMLTGELPFHAPTVAGILMKQITEAAPDVRRKRRDCPEDLALAIARCLEKDPENRWPTADALRRALEAGPRGLRGEAAGQRDRGTVDFGAGGTSLQQSRPPRGTLPPQHQGQPARQPLPRSPAPPRPREPLPRSPAALPPRLTEPEIVLKVRAQFARWAAISGGLFMINVATGITEPWFLIPAAGMGIGLLTNYGRLWQAGYSWRDVLSRPPAPDAVETTLAKPGKLPRLLPLPRAEEFGGQTAAILQVHGDRAAIYKLLDKLPPADREVLPDIAETVDALYQRATELAQTLHAMDSNLADADSVDQVNERIAAVLRDPPGPARDQRLALLERQRQTLQQLQERRAQVAAHLESCVLAIQNVRFDLLRLRSAGIAAVLGDLTQATQQARALSRDVDHAIAAAGEVRAVLRP